MLMSPTYQYTPNEPYVKASGWARLNLRIYERSDGFVLFAKTTAKRAFVPARQESCRLRLCFIEA